MSKLYSFNFHYNKPASKAANHNILTVHYRGVCHLVSDLICEVPIRVRHRKRQPHCVMAGKGIVKISNGKAVITNG
jgi:hypothetical protein